MKFKLEIEMCNDAMQTPQDVAGALHPVLRRLSRLSDEDFKILRETDCSTRIHDSNGNTVGSWRFKE